MEVLSQSEFWFIYWEPSAVRGWAPSQSLGRAFALRVTTLLQALITAAFAVNASLNRTKLIVRLVLQELTEMPDATTSFPLPASTVGRPVADLAFADHHNQLSVSELASRAATSVRTISRLFPAETRMTFKAWRQWARIVRAINQLSTGDPVTRVLTDAGFATAAAFSFAFRQFNAVTPMALLEVWKKT